MGSRNQLLDNSRLGVVEVLAVVALVVVALDVRDVSGRTPLRQNNGATAVPSSPPVGTLSNGLQLLFAMQLLVKCQQVFGLAWQANTHWHFTSSYTGKRSSEPHHLEGQLSKTEVRVVGGMSELAVSDRQWWSVRLRS